MTRDRETARRIAQEVQPLGGSVYYVGGCVRDRLLGRESKDLDIEVHGVTPQQLEIVLDRMGGRRTVGVSFGVYGLAGCGLDIAMPRRETTVGRGHRDFTVEVERSLRVLDGSVTVLCAKGGVEPQSETVWRQADHYHVPRMIYVNKMDIMGADFYNVLHMIHDRLKCNAVPIQLPIGAEDSFIGIVDLLEMNCILYDTGDETGAKFDIAEIPDDMKEIAEEYREKLLEAATEADDELLEVTPKSLRIRKTILNKELRMKATHGNKKVLQ